MFLPLITVNCAILGVALFMVERDYTFAEPIVYGAGSGAGWMLAIVSMAAIQKKLRYADVPRGAAGVRHQHDHHRPDGHGVYAVCRDILL